MVKLLSPHRYDIFIQYYRLGSTRFIFNPGQPLDLDRSSYVYSSQEQEELIPVKEEAPSLELCDVVSYFRHEFTSQCETYVMICQLVENFG